MEQLTALDESVETESSHHISRRTLVKGGLVAGGALWAVPAVQVLGMGKAFAATASADNSISWVGLVLQCGNTYTTVKIDHGDLSNAICPVPTGGPDQGAFWDYVNANATWGGATGACPSGVTASATSTATSYTLTVSFAGCTLVGYMIHDGQFQGASFNPQGDAFPPASGNTVVGKNYTFTVPSLPSLNSASFTKSQTP